MKINKPLAKKPPFFDIDIRTVADIDKDPRFYIEETKEIPCYWTDGKQIYYRHSPIEKANPETFVYFNGFFAKDDKHCYIVGRPLKGANPKTFEMLNECYAADDKSVWTSGGRFESADISTFEVCDEGIHRLDDKEESSWEFSDGIKRVVRMDFPYGYAKDSKQVYYEDYHGKIKILAKANPTTFTSLNDGDFAKDDKSVFYGKATLPKANPATWQKLSHFYSKDDKRIYCRNKLLKEADYDTFEVILLTSREGYQYPYGKDKNQYYYYGNPLTEAEALHEMNKPLREE
ncbi:MAG: DKNYY domain-containing protein [Capnocytophaga sp.]|nr:DKNYY domain-containing protein [Capnocytophaga sp.]